MKILIYGSTGWIGRATLKYLAENFPTSDITLVSSAKKSFKYKDKTYQVFDNSYLNSIKDREYDYFFNYAFPLILRQKSFTLRNRLENHLEKNGIEFRRGNAGGGNQLRQPYLQKITKNINLKNFPNVEHIHHFGYYIGNYPSLSKKRIIQLCSIINKLK